eukprot:scaffold326825_cov52-Tisochrysis_lutea.AAC.1
MHRARREHLLAARSTSRRPWAHTRTGVCAPFACSAARRRAPLPHATGHGCVSRRRRRRTQRHGACHSCR